VLSFRSLSRVALGALRGAEAPLFHPVYAAVALPENPWVIRFAKETKVS
jgi:hypothetical protein